MKIAIITSEKIADYDGIEYAVASKCTEFEEVDEKTYKLLVSAQYKYNFRVIRSPDDLKLFIKNTVSDYMEYIKKEEARILSEKKERERKKLERQKAMEKTKKEEKLKLYEELKKEFNK